MANKTLKIKRIFVYSIYNSLKNTPPKDYPTTGEIKDTISSVLPAFKEHLPEYITMLTEAENLSLKVAAREIPEEEAKKQVDVINAKWKEYNAAHGQEMCDVSLSEEGFKTLRMQFEREGEGWGKRWTANIEEFTEVMDAFSEAAK